MIPQSSAIPWNRYSCISEFSAYSVEHIEMSLIDLDHDFTQCWPCCHRVGSHDQEELIAWLAGADAWEEPSDLWAVNFSSIDQTRTGGMAERVTGHLSATNITGIMCHEQGRGHGAIGWIWGRSEHNISTKHNNGGIQGVVHRRNWSFQQCPTCRQIHFVTSLQIPIIQSWESIAVILFWIHQRPVVRICLNKESAVGHISINSIWTTSPSLLTKRCKYSWYGTIWFDDLCCDML